MRKAISAAAVSVIQKVFHTVWMPSVFVSRNAMGMLKSTYLSAEMMRDCGPFPSASRAPADTMDSEDMTKPKQIVLRAGTPARMSRDSL